MTRRVIQTDIVLQEIHQESDADQSALYYLAYPSFGGFILMATTGKPDEGERYWRPQCADVETVRRIRRAKKPVELYGQSMTGNAEKIVAVPIRNGDNVIGTVVHCYSHKRLSYPDAIESSVSSRSQELFEGWIDFLVEEQSRPLPALFHIAGIISSSLDLDRVLLSVVEQATVLFRAKMSSLMLVDWKKKELELITAYGCSLNYLDKSNLPLDRSILGKVVRENRMVQVQNIFEEPMYLHKDHAAREGVVSLLAAPISFQHDVLGVLNIYSAAPRRWQRSEKELLTTFAAHAAIAITNARVHQQNMSMEERLQVSAKLATLGELAAGLAHEIRNPLAVINMLIHSWKSSQPEPEDFEHDLDVIAQKISDLNRLVTDLLDLARTRPLDRQWQDMDDLIDRLFRLLRHRINQQRVKIHKEMKTEETLVYMDRERIEQAILNLLLNALDVTPEKGTITVTLERDEEFMTVHVADNGSGIPAENLPQLFKAFRSTKTHGIGLGLPMTRRIVEEHKGQIFVSRNEPDGATLTIQIPLKKPD